MGSMEIPSQSKDIIKVPTAHYEFGANFLDPKVALHFILSLFWMGDPLSSLFSSFSETIEG